MPSALKQTPLFHAHTRAGAKVVDFGGWEMPVSYGSQIEEHHAVRNDAGMFDVSHMLSVDVTGPDSKKFLRRLLANDVARLATPGKALYSCMLNPEGGVIDDLIVYFFDAERWRVVVNAGCAQSDVEWMRRVMHAEHFDVGLTARRDLAMIAVQGPHARSKVWEARPAWQADTQSLAPFSSVFVEEQTLVARTGYTGEDGFEIVLPATQVQALWDDLTARGVRPCGLGARDTLRLEAGMNLYGQDMDESVQPAESGLSWTVSLHDAEREFIGRDAIDAAASQRVLVGVKLLRKGVMRAHMALRTALGDGEITSGTMSPTMGVSIAMARVPGGVAAGDRIEVQMRGEWAPAEVVKLPFVRHGKILVA
jgi:aminomethyltransferase